MGQHTWFYKDSALIYNEDQSLDYESDDFDFSDNNESEYHDIFRTDERNEGGTYIDDIILKSKEECIQWLKTHSHYHYFKSDEEMWFHLNEFWEKYPNGGIRFG